MNRRKSIVMRAAFVVGVGLATIAWTALKLRHAYGLPPRFATVESGILYRSAQPSTSQLGKSIDQFGLRTLLIVREADSQRVTDEIEFAKRRGLNVVHIPVESRQPIPESQVDQFFRCLDDPRNHPVLVHCSAGRHRTGYLCARYRLERQGWTPQKAIDELMSFGFDAKNQTAVLDQLRTYRPADPRDALKASAEPGSSP